MQIKVYHKRSRQHLATYNEADIVEFCLRNQDTIKNYYFAPVGGKNELMEWEIFAAKHNDLFSKKAAERMTMEMTEEISAEAGKERKKRLWTVLFLFVIAGCLAVAAWYFLFRPPAPSAPSTLVVRSVPDQPVPAEKKQEVYPLKRADKPEDATLSTFIPSRMELSEKWQTASYPLTKFLTPDQIKEEMDQFLPAVKTCFEQQVQKGDKNLRGTLNLKIRVTGDGVVRDVVFPDEKYSATFFGDCIADAIKKKGFRMFKGKSQVFSYYFHL